MAWYWWVLIILVVLVFIVSKNANVKHEAFLADISTWQIGDNLIMKHLHNEFNEMAEKNGMKYPKLVKWDEDEILIDIGSDYNYLIKHSYIKENKSDIWRNRHARMNNYMSKINAKGILNSKKKREEQGKESKMEIKMKGGEIWIDGKPLMGMPEIYLKIYAGYAQEEENFNLLAKIREELKKHR